MKWILGSGSQNLIRHTHLYKEALKNMLSVLVCDLQEGGQQQKKKRKLSSRGNSRDATPVKRTKLSSNTSPETGHYSEKSVNKSASSCCLTAGVI